jgi:alkylation response protein AidB-like acyl-CoA dehydrogenase
MQIHGGRSVRHVRQTSRVYRHARIPVISEGAHAIQRTLIYK